MNRLSIAAFFLLFSFALNSGSDAKEIKFETADGKFKVTGTVGYYVANGKPVESPAGDEKGLAVVIIRPDGKATNPVPVKMLSTKTKEILFRKSKRPPLAIAPFDEKKAKTHQKAWARFLGLPVVTTNSIGIKFVVIPPGEFMMGMNLDERSSPVHEVTITRPFELGVYEVTQEQYTAVVGRNPSRFKDARNPAERVTWHDAMEFCRLLSEMSVEKEAGYKYRLPTEAEWEYACRAGTTTNFYFGHDGTRLSEFAWFKTNSENTTHSVGHKKPNAFGIFDLYGNVSEWCNDRFGEYPHVAVIDPVGPLTGKVVLSRGHSYITDAHVMSSWGRPRNNRDTKAEHIGFRVLRSSIK